MAATNIHIHLRHIELDFTLYPNKTFSLRERLLNSFLLRGHTSESFCAVNDISLSIASGERVVLVGPNGAGKSSLLKIIAGIYPASHGEIDIQGRITPLIEMGAGFHHELTGRENAFLNGAILGFSRREVHKCLPKILEFSEIPEKFMDTSIKYYSSGMKVRLAFSIAMELDPEILILDEIFSAGDAHFVDKACERLKVTAPITILVTHDMDLARKLAKRCIWLDRGGIVQDGVVEDILPAYEKAMAAL